MRDKLKGLIDEKTWKFLLVGVLNTLVGNGLSFLLLNLINWGSMHVYAVTVSSAVSTTLASIMSYFLNRYFTFQYKGSDKAVLLRFALNIAVCYFLAYGLGAPLAELLLSSMGTTIQKNGAMLVGMCLFVGLNYIGQRYFTFREK